jgi:hypothetical protein
MTEIAEAIATLAFKASKKDCWYCKAEPEDPEAKFIEDEDPSGEDDDEDEVPENDLHNDASELGKSLIGDGQDKPQWKIRVMRHPKDDDKITTVVVCAAHHLIPGNASLKNATSLLKFMKKGSTVDSDVGFDVNGVQNGVWLPGSYGVRKGAEDFRLKWSAYSYKDEYALAAMTKDGKRQFHDSHPEYSENVLQTLKTIGDKMIAAKDSDKCPACDGTKKDKKRAPYGLVQRLHVVSSEHRKMLLRAGVTKKVVDAGYFTSERTKLLFAKR